MNDEQIIKCINEMKFIYRFDEKNTPEIKQARKESIRLKKLIGRNYRSGNHTEALSLALKDLQISKVNFGSKGNLLSIKGGAF